MATLREVAALAGVSATTVSNIINNSGRIAAPTRLRVERAMTQLGYVPQPHGAAQVSPAQTPKQSIAHAPPHHAFSGVSGDLTHTLLKTVRATQPISRAELARRLHVNRSTVTEVVRPLLASGSLHEAAAPQRPLGRTGRPPVGLSLHAANEFVIGIFIGVRRTSIGAMALDGTMLGKESFPTLPDVDALLIQVRLGINHLRQRLAAQRTLALVSISVPGPTDAGRARLLYAPHFGWQDVPIAEALSKSDGRRSKKHFTSAIEVPVIVENDATAAAVYEARRVLREANTIADNDFVVLTVGIGIGVGIVFGGEVYRGTGVGGGLAGEFGHMTIAADGLECVCGNHGCWEVYASTESAILAYTAGIPILKQGEPVTFKEIVRRAESGDKRAREVLGRTGKYLGIGIGNVISGIGIERIIVTGNVVHGWKFIYKTLSEAVGRTMVGRLARWSVKPGDATAASLGGALEVAVEQYLRVLATKTLVNE